MEEVEVGLEKDSIQVALEEVGKVVVGLDQVQEQVLIEIGYDVLNVGSMIIYYCAKDCLNMSDGGLIYQTEQAVRADTANV